MEVHPAQVADVLCVHPDVERAMVVERRDGHGLAGYVVSRCENRPSAVSVLDHAAALMAPAAVPTALVLLDELRFS